MIARALEITRHRAIRRFFPIKYVGAAGLGNGPTCHRRKVWVALDQHGTSLSCNRSDTSAAAPGKGVKNEATFGSKQTEQVSNELNRLGGRVPMQVTDDRQEEESVVVPEQRSRGE